MYVSRLQGPTLIATTALLLCACAGRLAGPVSAPGDLPWSGRAAFLPLANHRPRNHKIQHVVVIIQENRTVDNLFQGFPGARTSRFGFDKKGQRLN